ncbi:unnamed protein product [Gordionus sp. m RMFG-2023]
MYLKHSNSSLWFRFAFLNIFLTVQANISTIQNINKSQLFLEYNHLPKNGFDYLDMINDTYNYFNKLAYKKWQPYISLVSFIDADFVIGALLELPNPTLLSKSYDCGKSEIEDDKMVIQSYSMFYAFRKACIGMEIKSENCKILNPKNNGNNEHLNPEGKTIKVGVLITSTCGNSIRAQV